MEKCINSFRCRGRVGKRASYYRAVVEMELVDARQDRESDSLITPPAISNVLVAWRNPGHVDVPAGQRLSSDTILFESS